MRLNFCKYEINTSKPLFRTFKHIHNHIHVDTLTVSSLSLTLSLSLSRSLSQRERETERQRDRKRVGIAIVLTSNGETTNNVLDYVNGPYTIHKLGRSFHWLFIPHLYGADV